MAEMDPASPATPLAVTESTGTMPVAPDPDLILAGVEQLTAALTHLDDQVVGAWLAPVFAILLEHLPVLKVQPSDRLRTVADRVGFSLTINL